jgi:hypothetical protein
VRQGLSGKHNNSFVETLLKANLLPRSPLALRSASNNNLWALLTGTHPFCSKTVTFLPSPSARPAFRRINRREIAGLVGIAEAPKFLKHPLADFGLAS